MSTRNVTSAAHLRLGKFIGKEVEVYSFHVKALLLALSNDGKSAFVQLDRDKKKAAVDPDEVYAPRKR
jgi:hypothetical protein